MHEADIKAGGREGGGVTHFSDERTPLSSSTSSFLLPGSLKMVLFPSSVRAGEEWSRKEQQNKTKTKKKKLQNKKSSGYGPHAEHSTNTSHKVSPKNCTQFAVALSICPLKLVNCCLFFYFFFFIFFPKWSFVEVRCYSHQSALIHSPLVPTSTKALKIYSHSNIDVHYLLFSLFKPTNVKDGLTTG